MQQYTDQRNPRGGLSSGTQSYYTLSPGGHPVRRADFSQSLSSPVVVPQEFINRFPAEGYYIERYPAGYVAGEPLQDQLGTWPILVGLGSVAAGIISWYFVNFDYEYSDALQDVAGYANFNFWKKEVPWYEAPFYVSWPKRYYANFVQNVVNTYMNLVLDNPQLPEYSAYSPEIQKTLFREMSKILPYSVKDMQYIMNATDYAVSDGTIKIIAMKLPRTARDHQRMYTQPQIVKEELEKYNKERDKSLLEQVTDFVGTLGVVAATVGVVVGGVWLYNILPKKG